jgi:hypothetical protein
MNDREDDFFIGWAEKAPKADRRFLLGAAAVLLTGAALGGAALGRRQSPPGPGVWDQAAIAVRQGLLIADPYPALILETPAGLRTALLGSNGKLGVADRLPPDMIGGPASVRGSFIERGKRMMIAVDAAADAIRLPSPGFVAPARPPEVDEGEVMLAGEILDAKCWLGAMRPGWGKAHKGCAALCAKGGLPLAFCEAGECGGALDAPLFVDERGQPHKPSILPFVADPVVAIGRLVRIGDMIQFRVPQSAIRRL